MLTLQQTTRMYLNSHKKVHKTLKIRTNNMKTKPYKELRKLELYSQKTRKTFFNLVK